MARLLVPFMAVAAGIGCALAAQTYPPTNKLVVKPDAYELQWESNSTHMRLQVRAKTLGFVGFGIPEQTSGSMPGADVLVAWVDAAGLPHAEDYHVLAQKQPILDSCGNWVAVDGYEDAGWTTVDVVRVLDTGDSQDRPFPIGMAKLIWAHSSSNSDSLAYHGSYRGPFGAPLRGPVTDELKVLQNDPAVLQFNFTNNIADPVGPAQTVYRVTDLMIPANVPSAHIVGVEHLVQPETAKYVHHFVLYGCNDLGASCNVLWAWAPGGVPFVLPSTAGLRVGEQEPYSLLKMDTHYDNPNGDTFYDGSGLKLYYTTGQNMRANDAVALQIGDFGVMNPNGIPIGAVDYEYEYDCPGELCTTNWPTMTAFSSFLHMHALGQQIWLTHWRNNQYLGDIDRIDFWDFAFQANSPINTSILPGDTFRLHCTYTNTLGKVVPFKDASDDEMCLAYLYVFPSPDATKLRCGYSYSSQTGNRTYCDGGVQNVTNPTARDPPSWKARKFGVEPGINYPCPSTSTSSAASTSTSSAASTSTAFSSSTSATSITSTSANASQTSSDVSAASFATIRVPAAALLLLGFVAGVQPCDNFFKVV